MARVCKVDEDACGSKDWFFYKCKTRKLYRVSRLEPMVHKLADGTKEKIAGAQATRCIYRGEFVAFGMSFDFAKVAWKQYLDMKIYYFGVPWLKGKDALLRRSLSAAAIVTDEGQASTAAVAGRDDCNDGDGDCDLKDAIGLEDVALVGAKRRFMTFKTVFVP